MCVMPSILQRFLRYFRNDGLAVRVETWKDENVSMNVDRQIRVSAKDDQQYFCDTETMLSVPPVCHCTPMNFGPNNSISSSSSNSNNNNNSGAAATAAGDGKMIEQLNKSTGSTQRCMFLKVLYHERFKIFLYLCIMVILTVALIVTVLSQLEHEDTVMHFKSIHNEQNLARQWATKASTMVSPVSGVSYGVRGFLLSSIQTLPVLNATAQQRVAGQNFGHSFSVVATHFTEHLPFSVIVLSAPGGAVAQTYPDIPVLTYFDMFAESTCSERAERGDARVHARREEAAAATTAADGAKAMNWSLSASGAETPCETMQTGKIYLGGPRWTTFDNRTRPLCMMSVRTPVYNTTELSMHSVDNFWGFVNIMVNVRSILRNLAVPGINISHIPESALSQSLIAPSTTGLPSEGVPVADALAPSWSKNYSQGDAIPTRSDAQHASRHANTGDEHAGRRGGNVSDWNRTSSEVWNTSHDGSLSHLDYVWYTKSDHPNSLQVVFATIPYYFDTSNQTNLFDEETILRPYDPVYNEADLERFIAEGQTYVVYHTTPTWYLTVREREPKTKYMTPRVIVTVVLTITLAAVALLLAGVFGYYISTRAYDGNLYAPKSAPFAILSIGPVHADDLWSLVPVPMAAVMDKFNKLFDRQLRRHHGCRIVQMHPYTNSCITRTVEAAIEMAMDLLTEMQRRPIDASLRELLSEDEGMLMMCCGIHWCTRASVSAALNHGDGPRYDGEDVIFASRMWVHTLPNHVTISAAAEPYARAMPRVRVTRSHDVFVRGQPVRQSLYTVTDEHNKHLQKAAHRARLSLQREYAAYLHEAHEQGKMQTKQQQQQQQQQTHSTLYEANISQRQGSSGTAVFPSYLFGPGVEDDLANSLSDYTNPFQSRTMSSVYSAAGSQECKSSLGKAANSDRCDGTNKNNNSVKNNTAMSDVPLVCSRMSEELCASSCVSSPLPSAHVGLSSCVAHGQSSRRWCKSQLPMMDDVVEDEQLCMDLRAGSKEQSEGCVRSRSRSDSSSSISSNCNTYSSDNETFDFHSSSGANCNAAVSNGDSCKALNDKNNDTHTITNKESEHAYDASAALCICDVSGCSTLFAANKDFDCMNTDGDWNRPDCLNDLDGIPRCHDFSASYKLFSDRQGVCEQAGQPSRDTSDTCNKSSPTPKQRGILFSLSTSSEALKLRVLKRSTESLALSDGAAGPTHHGEYASHQHSPSIARTQASSASTQISVSGAGHFPIQSRSEGIDSTTFNHKRNDSCNNDDGDVYVDIKDTSSNNSSSDHCHGVCSKDVLRKPNNDTSNHIRANTSNDAFPAQRALSLSGAGVAVPLCARVPDSSSEMAVLPYSHPRLLSYHALSETVYAPHSVAILHGPAGTNASTCDTASAEVNWCASKEVSGAKPGANPFAPFTGSAAHEACKTHDRHASAPLPAALAAAFAHRVGAMHEMCAARPTVSVAANGIAGEEQYPHRQAQSQHAQISIAAHAASVHSGCPDGVRRRRPVAWTDCDLRRAFEHQAMVMDVSYDTVRTVVQFFYMSILFLVRPLGVRERDNLYHRLRMAFGVPQQHILEHLAARCTIVYIQQQEQLRVRLWSC